MKPYLLLPFLVAQPLAAITIQIDYSYDTTNFFDTQPKRDAMEAVAKFYGDMIQDKLLRIDVADFPGTSWIAIPKHPATGNIVEIPNLVVPEDTVIVYVGARDLGSTVRGLGGPGGWGSLAGSYALFDRITGRGSAAAAYTTPVIEQTDFALWGGSIAFDIDSSWNFSQTQNLNGVEFVTVALHEMGHVLGIGLANSWDNLISAGKFTGSACNHSHGSDAPVQNGGGHFETALVSPAFGSFGATHGNSRPVLMLATSTDANQVFDTASDLDLSALVDIGWEIRPSPPLTVTALGPSASAFTWSSSSFLNHKVQRGTNLQNFDAGSATIGGNGSIMAWTDPAPPATTAFYRLASTRAAAQAQAPASMLQSTSVSESPVSAFQPPRSVGNCEFGAN